MARTVDRTPAYVVQQGRIPDQLWIEPSPRRVRASFGGKTIADTRRALLVFEPKRPPTYWIPFADVAREYLEPEDGVRASGTVYWTLRVGDRVVDKAARSEPHLVPERAALADHLAFYPGKIDAWYEEEDEVIGHPRDPYHRVDVLRSSRHVRVELDGLTLAESDHPTLLFETSLPTRYYFDPAAVRMDLLVPTDSSTVCPYKGVARYWSVQVGHNLVRDLAWSYPTPIEECGKVANLVSFYNEKVDLFVDGEQEERPTTRWS